MRGWAQLQPVSPRRAARLRGLGVMGQSVAHFQAESEWWDLAAKFRDASRQLAAAEDLFRRDARGSGLDGRELIRLRNELTALQSEFQFLWTAVFGSPVNLGLGAFQVPAAIAATGAALLLAAKLALLAAAIGVVYQLATAYRSSTHATVVQSQAQAQTVNSLLAAAQAADANAIAAQFRGDNSAAQQYAAQANALRAQAAGQTQQGLPEWLEQNWIWVAAVTLGVVLGPGLIRKL